MTTAPAPSPAAALDAPWQRGARWRMAIAGALLVLSLGLPWGHALTWHTVFHPGWYVAGLCRSVQTWDGWYESVCEPGTAGASWTGAEAGGTEPVAGARHGGRFGVAAGLATIVLAWRRRRPRLLWLAAVVIAVFTVLTAGLGFASAGSGAAWLAAALLAAPGRLATRPAAVRP